MKSKMKSLRLCFLIFLLFPLISCCEGCFEEERQALLGLSSRFYMPFSSDTDCCEWREVECNSSTGRVAALNLWISHDQYINYSDYSVFRDLKKLDLSNYNIVGCVGGEGLPNLEFLDLPLNKLDNATSILSCLDHLSSLKSLNLISNNFNTSSLNLVFETLSSKLHNLEVLDISYNYLANDILPSLEGFTSLKELYLNGNELDSDFDIHALKTLEVLDLSYNNFNDSDIASAISGLSSLKSLNLEYCELTWRSIFNISKLDSLEILELSGNQLNENMWWLIENDDGFTWPRNLQVLSLRENSFTDKTLSSLNGLPHLKSLDLSYNQLKRSIDISGLLTLTNLTDLDLSYNHIHNFVVHQGSKSLSRLDVLSLDGNMIYGNKLRDSLRALSSSIRVIDTGDNKFKGAIVAEDFKDLSNLEHLTLDYSINMENKFFKSIGELTSLKVLSISCCYINGTFPQADWFKLKNLEELDLISNEFYGPLPSSFGNMTSLQILELSQNHLIGQFGSNMASLPSLEYFGFRGNQFEVPISFTSFANHSSIKFIYGEGNKVILDLQPSMQSWIPKFQLQELSLPLTTTELSSFLLPKFLLYQKDLTNLDLSSLWLEGGFPHWLLENNTKLNEVVVRNCSFMGNMQLPLRPLPMIESIDVSNNMIIGEIPNKNISSIYPNLKLLNLSNNYIQGSIPRELAQIQSLSILDVSNNQMSGEILEDIFEVGHQISFLKLSNNKFEGPIFTIPTYLECLLLNDNNFIGRLPRNIFNTSIISLDVSNNHLAGKIPSLINNLSGLMELRMSNNHFEGFIPLELAQHKDLNYLDLSQNNLIGLVPSFLNSSVKFIHLSNNHLSGLSKKMFNGNSNLVMLDLSYNEISSNIEDVIQDLSYTKLNFLLLKGNHFTGDIPKQLCHLIDLTMLDLSHNKFSSAIPHCLGKMPFDSKNLDPLLKASKGTFFVIEGKPSSIPLELKKETANFTSKNRVDTYTRSILVYMSGIDLSHNKLKGNIPYDLGNLKRIQVLNLSHNDLTGKIPDSFSNLIQTESLDLSFNKLSDQIPNQLNILTSLEVFSVAHNNLSGPIPEWTKQFGTFDESSYEGNPFLCGPPLSKSCNPTHIIIPNDSERDNDNLVDMYVFCVSFVVAYILALLATAIALYINPYWKQVWFYYMELVSLNCCYFIIDNLYRLL